jgi:hypothetical protein
MTDERKHGPIRWAYRFLAGRPMKGHPGHPYRRPGPARLAGWERQAWRLGVTAYLGLLLWAPGAAAWLAGLVVAVLVSGSRRLAGRSRFHREYIAPTLAAMAPALGLDGSLVDLHVDPSLGNLTPRLAKPLSPAEEKARLLYGRRLEPIVRWLPERAQRVLWWAQRRARPVTAKTNLLRRPVEQAGPRIELVARTPYLTAEQRMLISSIINSKIPVADLVESWHQVGPKVRARWTVRKRPPAFVGHEDFAKIVDSLKEWEFYIGKTSDGQIVKISLRDDSPHIAVSAGSGAGKSELAKTIAVQVLRRSGRVLILDRKGSHRWAIGMPGVDYCTKPAQMHEALIKAAALANERNDLALYEDEDWDPGPRVFVICEELNATIGQLTNYWADTREKGDPKRSPAVAALAELLFMGRSAKHNVLAIAQMLTARAIGGPEARENFGIRFLARYTKNAWKMLVPEAAMPRASRTLGRWQVVIGGTAIEVQVVYVPTKQARALANPGDGLDSALARDVTDDGDMITLQEAVDGGVIPWKYEAAKQRMSRKVGAVPKPRGQRGKAFLYERGDLIRWRESVTDKETVS